MSRFEQFSQRYHKVKQGVEEQAELRYAAAQIAAGRERDTLQTMAEERAHALQRRGEQQGATAWLAWNQYLALLDMRLAEQAERVATAQDAAETARTQVKDAHVEQERWKTLVQQLQNEAQQQAWQATQREADDRASMRHGRGGM